MEEDMVEHWIWLQQALGANSPKPAKLLEYFGGIGAIYKARRVDYINTGFLTERELKRLCDKSLLQSEKIVGDCLKNGFDILTLPEMPQRLQNIYAPPCVLYVFGQLPQPYDGVYIGMVGTRAVTPYGVEAATKIALGLAHCGAVVVSGMALGVDGASHKGALKGGGKTVAVIGCGIDIDYPAKHTGLKRLIAQNGAVVSEYPPGTRPDRKHFPVRNRIIAGLSLGCVVVEAGRRSGALITASLAAEMGRDVFAVPGSIFSSESEGTNRLLKDGAKPVCSVTDILEEYIGVCSQNIISKMSEYGKAKESEQLSFDSVRKTQNIDKTKNNNVSSKDSSDKKNTGLDKNLNMTDNKLNQNETSTQKTITKTTQNSNNPPQPTAINHPEDTAAKAEKNITESQPANSRGAAVTMSEMQKKVYGVLSDEPIHVDQIALRANLELRVVLAVLTTLEIEGYVQSFPGRRYTVMH